MSNKKVLLIILVLFAVLIGGAAILYDKLGESVEGPSVISTPGPVATVNTKPEATETTEVPAENKAPDFIMTDLNGNEVKLSDFFGKPVILNFWASWCGPCKSEMPDFETVYNEYKDDINFLMVNLTDGSRETVKTASEYIKKAGYTFPVYYDTKYEGASAYGVSAVPCTYFIDKDGNGIAQGRGALDLETLKRGIGMIFEE